MAELERELRAVGRRVEWPPAPELGGRVRMRLGKRGPGRRRALLVAFALLAVAIAAAFAVPSARTAILRWFGLKHVRVVRVSSLPQTRRLSAADLGMKTTLPAAERTAGFQLLLPRDRPDSVYLQYVGGAVRVNLVFGPVERPRLLLSEFRGTGSSKYIEKLATPGTTVEHVSVGGDPGLWLSGSPHAVYYAQPGEPQLVFVDEPFLAGNTLVWERAGGLTLRLEGKFGKDEAERLANSLR